MIVFILILFSGIYLSNGNQVTGVDIFQQLKSKNISCDLHDFIKPADHSDDEYQLLKQDLTKYCSNSSSYQLLCHMIFIEIEIACLVPNASRPSPMKYTSDHRSKHICSLNKISLTNDWIWGKLSSNEKQQIGSTPTDLCSKITSNNETLRLVKFFYKIAPRIRRFDTLNKTDSVVHQISSTNETSTEKTNSALIQQETPEVLNQTIEDTGNKTNRIESSTSRLNTNQTDNELKEKTNIESKNEVKKPGEGSPFGRAGNDRERLQINERPKPKVLDVESVFKANKDEERNWVEGKNIDKQGGKFPSIKFEENPLPKAPFIRKRNPFRLKFNRHMDDDDDDKHDDGHVSNSFITPILIFILCIILVYLILHNKNKILGLIIEGCKRRRALNNRRTSMSHRTRLSQSTNQ